MKDTRNASLRKSLDKGRPDYYITPSHDFTQYTRDCEEKYWSKDTAFNWSQSVPASLRQNLENLDKDEFYKVTFMVSLMVKEKIEHKISLIRQEHLPLEEDALKDIGECIASDMNSIHEALMIQSPLESLEKSARKLEDQMEIVQRELADLKELQRLGLLREGINVKHLETDSEKQQQSVEISRLTDKLNKVQSECKLATDQNSTERKQLQTKIRNEFSSIEPKVLSELEKTLDLLERTLQSKQIPTDDKD